MGVSHNQAGYRSYIRVQGRGMHTQLEGVPQIPDVVDRHFRNGNENLPEDLVPLADEAITAAMQEISRRHLAAGKRGEEVDFEEFVGEYW